MEIECEKGVIDIVDANYGRLSRTDCNRDNYPSDYDSTTCRAENSTDVLRDVCGNQKRCTFTIFLGLFGDPCVGIEKYLDVEFQCIVTSK